MSVEAFVTFEKSVAVFSKLPFKEGTVLCMAELAQLPTRMASDFIKSFLAFMALLFTSKEGEYASDYCRGGKGKDDFRLQDQSR